MQKGVEKVHFKLNKPILSPKPIKINNICLKTMRKKLK